MLFIFSYALSLRTDCFTRGPVTISDEQTIVNHCPKVTFPKEIDAVQRQINSEDRSLYFSISLYLIPGSMKILIAGHAPVYPKSYFCLAYLLN